MLIDNINLAVILCQMKKKYIQFNIIIIVIVSFLPFHILFTALPSWLSSDFLHIEWKEIMQIAEK